MFLAVLYLWPLLQVVLSENDTNTDCTSGFRYANSDSSVPTNINVTEVCNGPTPCIGKCCPLHQTLLLNTSDNTLSCVDNTYLTIYNLTSLDDYSEIEFYDDNISENVIKSTKQLKEFAEIYSEDFRSDSCFLDISSVLEPPTYKTYLLKNGSSVIRRLNSFKQWIVQLSPLQYCVERQVVLDQGTVSKPELVIRMSILAFDENTVATKPTVIAFGFLVSCVFLALVLAVYAVLPQLRNMAGMILMAYVATLITAFILRAVQVLAPASGLFTKNKCIWLGLMSNYTMIASFTWMNVMSFDIWWSMRGFRKLRETHRRGVLVKLAWYSLYGWGAPLLQVAFAVAVENMDLTHLPYFIKSYYSDPQTCFIDEDEMLFYLDVPILITTCINITLFLATAYNIWRINRGVSQLSVGNSRINKKEQNRFGIYLKLSLAMGINWIIEVAGSFCAPESVWWYAPDVFNSLVGLFIFIIFICKRRIIVLLCKRFSIGNKLVRKWQPSDSKCTESTRLNGSNNKRKMLESVTYTSDEH